MTTKQRFYAAVASHGATVDMIISARDGRKVDFLYVDAPAGMVWRANGIHVLTNSPSQDGAEWSYRDHLDNMEWGLTPCDDPDCDHCQKDEQ